MRGTGKLTAIFTAIVTSGCAAAGSGAGGEATATVSLRDADGRTVATATLVQDGGEVEINLQATALPPGAHGVHLHETGTCTAPDFSSAGGHFSPASRQHGFENPNGPHAGDLPNIQVGADGRGRFLLENERVTLTAGPASLFDSDGTALVIHAADDDYRTDPSGNSGARIACGVVTR